MPLTVIPRRRASAGFWTTAVAFLAMMSFTTIPTPLYAIYQKLDGFPTATVTVIFAAYALGVMVALYLVGHLSDWRGRRPVIILAGLLQIVAAVMFLSWTSVTGLLLARIVSGIGIGLLTATATAYLVDLRAVSQPNRTALAATVGGIANLGGLSLGPLLAGALAEWLPDPLHLPYLVHLVILVIVTLAMLTVPETVSPHPQKWHPQRVRVPDAERTVYWAAGFGAFAAFAVTGFFGSVAPTVLSQVMGTSDRFVAGISSFAVFAAAALSQVVFARLRMVTQLRLGTACMAVGMLVLAAGALFGSLTPFLLGGILGGVGVGLLFRGGLATAGAITAPEHRGEVLAGVFLLAYAGMMIPPVLVGVAVLWLPIVPVTAVFALLVLALAVWAGTVLARRQSR